MSTVLCHYLEKENDCDRSQEVETAANNVAKGTVRP